MRQTFFRIWLATWVACVLWGIASAITSSDGLSTALVGLLIASLGMQINLPEEARR